MQPIIKTDDLTIKTTVNDTDWIIGVDLTEPDPEKATFKSEAVNVRGKDTISIDTIADMKQREGSFDGQSAVLNGFTIANDGGGGFFNWDATYVHVASDIDGMVVYVTGVTVGAWIRDNQGFVSVLWVGAKGDYNGVSGTDDTQAFKDAFSFADTYKLEVIVPNTGALYWVGDAVLPAGLVMTGLARTRVYNPSTVTEMIGSNCIVYNDSYSQPLHFSANCSVSNINFWGKSSVNGLSTASALQGIVFYKVSMLNYSRGFGTANTVNNSRFLLCHAQGNSRGFANLVDCHVTNCEVNVNFNGIDQQTGANDTVWLGNKVEFNDNNNWLFFNSQSNTVIGGVCDRAGQAGFRISNSEIQITSVKTRRNGRFILGGDECAHYFIEGSGCKVNIANMATKTGTDDGGGGDNTPNYSVSFTGSQPGSVNLIGGDATGAITEPLKRNVTPTSFYCTKVLGIDDFSNTGNYRKGTGKYGIRTGVVSVSGATTETVNLGQPELSTFSVINRRFEFSLRNEGTGGAFTGYMEFSFLRSGGGASSQFDGVSWESSVGLFGETTGIVRVTITNVATDATTFDLNIENTSGSNYKIFYKFN